MKGHRRGWLAIVEQPAVAENTDMTIYNELKMTRFLKKLYGKHRQIWQQ